MSRRPSPSFTARTQRQETMMTANPIERDAKEAVHRANGNGARRGRSSRIEAAGAATEAAEAAARAAEAAAVAAKAAMGDLRANQLIDALDREGLGGELPEPVLGALLTLARFLDGCARAALPQRDPGATLGNGTGPQAMLP